MVIGPDAASPRSSPATSTSPAGESPWGTTHSRCSTLSSSRTATAGGRAGQAVGLLVDIDGGAGVLVERAIRSPLGEGAGCPSIALVGRVARQLGGQVETHGVLLVSGEQTRVLGRRDDVIGRTDHQPHVADRFRLVAKGAECSDSGQR